MVLGPLGLVSHPCVEQEGGVCLEYHATRTLLKSNTSLGWEDLSFVGSARGPSAWVTHPHPPLLLLIVPAMRRLPLLLTTACSFTQPPPQPPAPLPRLSSRGLQCSRVSWKGKYHLNWKPPHVSHGAHRAMGTLLLQALPAGAAGSFCVTGYPPHCCSTGHWALTGGSLFIHNQRESAAVCYCNSRPQMSRL